MKPQLATLMASVLVWTQLPLRSADVRSPEPQMQVSWQDLGALVGGKKIQLITPEGAEIRGNVLAVEPGQLVLDIKKSSDKRSYPKGRFTMPRASVTTLSFTQTRNVWKIAGTAIGAGAGVAIAIPIALYSRNEGHADAGAALAVVAVAVPALAGYVIGRSADRKTVTVRVKD